MVVPADGMGCGLKVRGQEGLLEEVALNRDLSARWSQARGPSRFGADRSGWRRQCVQRALASLGAEAAGVECILPVRPPAFPVNPSA